MHELKCFKTPTSDYSCDICGLHMSESSEMYGCRLCNWDACLACYSGNYSYHVFMSSCFCVFCVTCFNHNSMIKLYLWEDDTCINPTVWQSHPRKNSQNSFLPALTSKACLEIEVYPKRVLKKNKWVDFLVLPVCVFCYVYCISFVLFADSPQLKIKKKPVCLKSNLQTSCFVETTSAQITRFASKRQKQRFKKIGLLLKLFVKSNVKKKVTWKESQKKKRRYKNSHRLLFLRFLFFFYHRNTFQIWDIFFNRLFFFSDTTRWISIFIMRSKYKV